ncbi:MAG: DUF1990 domain-containing protein [Actinomycetota bacterium]|nr:DUF1990 domain-containing protein [Actinomycetota bacterium]
MRPESLLGDSAARAALDELHDSALNFDLSERDGVTAARGWKVDEYRQRLPAETPGHVVSGGSWETARRLLRDYEFADPTVIRAVYHPERPLEGREMLLEARFYGLRFHFGVRVGGVIDETRDVEGRKVRVWGWNYRTLQGHLEMGQMDYEVWKWLDSGEVEFRIRRYSKPARIANPLVRLGFHLFGRREQVRFARSACERMARLTEAALEEGAQPPPVPLAANTVTVLPARAATPQRGASRPGAAATVAGMAETKLLAIYLNDHLAVLTVGRQLVKRMLGSSKDEAIRSFLEDVRPEIESSEREVERLLRDIGSSPSRLKRGAAWAAERAGLLKLNGSLTGYSPLSRLLELEGLRVVLEAERALWRSLERSASALAASEGAFAERARRAERQLERAEELRLVAADVALAGTDGRHL